MKRKDNININDSFQENNIPTIIFKRKNIKSRIILLLKILAFLTITTTISIVISLLVFKYKYEITNNRTDNISINEEYSKAIDNVKNSLVTIGGSKEDLSKNEYIDGNATGVIIDKDGRILTNYSVIKDLEEIYVNLPFINSEPLQANIFYRIEDRDIAVLSVNFYEDLTPIKVVSRDNIIEGENVLLISNSTSDEYIDNLVPGVITSKNRQLEVNNEKYNLIEVNTPINKFNTGGIITNLNGEVIGIASKKVTESMNVEGLYYAMDLSSLEKNIDYAKELKEILGILEGKFVEVDSRGNYGGLYVARVDKKGSSYTAGLRPTDIIIEVDGERFSGTSEVLKMVKNKQNGDTVTCKVMRSGDVIDMDIVLSNINK
ncbi:S1C family serine protease [Clostridium sp. AL.422]|uniref:S1C family serine protease n=1 Tax=Clostridium TaxID=1485 RepID=UPI00293DE477|nr:MULTISPECIES: S1C family serine protease [unclassified Clostridium]MDV4150248.1 S1C family serine protease [Clostridium sp. AL.422]